MNERLLWRRVERTCEEKTWEEGTKEPGYLGKRYLLSAGRLASFGFCIEAVFIIFNSAFNFCAATFSFAISCANANVFSQRLKSQRTFLNCSRYCAGFYAAAKTYLFKAVY